MQAVSTPGDVAANASRAARLVDRAGSEGARVVVLPELFLPGYHPPLLAQDPTTDVLAAACGTVDDPRLDPLRTAAERWGTSVVVGAAVRCAEGSRHLSSLLVAPDGSVVEAYRKQYLCGDHERRLFLPGRRRTVLDVDGWLLGLSICYDGCFPEHARAAALDGAHTYLCSVAYFPGGDHRRDTYYRARALENGMFVVLSAAAGGAPPWAFSGGSAVLDPEGRPLTGAARDGDDVLVADLDLELLEVTRAQHPMLADLPSGPEQGDADVTRIAAS